MSIIQQLEDLKEWSQDSTRYERRLNFRGGQLVQPGPGRQGYEGVTGFGKEKRGTDAAGREYRAKPLTKNQVNMMRKNLPDGIGLYPSSEIKGQWMYSFQAGLGKGTKDVKRVGLQLKATPENLERLIKLRDKTWKEFFPDRLSSREFKRLRFLPENIGKTNKGFAEVLNKLGYRTQKEKGKGKFVESTVNGRQVKLGISKDVGNIRPPQRTISELKKIIRNSSGGKDFLQVYSGNESVLRKRANRILADEVYWKTTGFFPPGATNEEKLWQSFYRGATKGDRIKIVGEFAEGNFPRDEDGYIDWRKKDKKGVQAWKRIEFIDTEAPKGKQKFKWGNLQADVDNAFGKGFFARNTKGYDLAIMDNQRLFGGEQLSTLVRDKLLMKDLEAKILREEGRKRKPTQKEIAKWKKSMEPGYAMTEAHHTEGVAKNPYKVEPAFRVANRRLKDLEKSYKAGTIDKATFIDEIKKLPGGIRHKLDDVMVGIKSTEVSRVKAAVKASGFNKNTANQIFKTYQKMGIGTKCQWKGKAEGGRIGFAAGGYDDCMKNAIKEHNKNLKSKDLTVRNEARAKQFNINKTKNMKSLMSLGARGGKNVLKLGRTWGIELEPIFEGAFYEYARRKGYTHEQAKEETFFWKMLDPSTKTGLLEGAEPLLEKELYTIRGEDEFMDVDHRPPMQDPEFGQVIGERKSVKRYVENEKALAAAYDKYNQLYTAYQVATTGKARDPEKAEQLMTASENLWEEIKGLEKQLNYDRDMYQAAVEKQQTEQGQRAIEYGEYGQGDTPELARRREEERYRLMNEKFPGYGQAQIDQKLEDDFYSYINPAFRSYKGQTVQNPQGLRYIPGVSYDRASDYYKDKDKMAYFAKNFRTEKAGGGIAGIRRPWAIPPVSGPVPQGGGLSSQFNRVKKLTE